MNHIKVGKGETRFSLDEADFTPFQWKALTRQAKVEKLCNKKSSRLAHMAAAYKALNRIVADLRQAGSTNIADGPASVHDVKGRRGPR